MHNSFFLYRLHVTDKKLVEWRGSWEIVPLEGNQNIQGLPYTYVNIHKTCGLSKADFTAYVVSSWQSILLGVIAQVSWQSCIWILDLVLGLEDQDSLTLCNIASRVLYQGVWTQIKTITNASELHIKNQEY